jgi:DNA-binding response OmpR family regulator
MTDAARIRALEDEVETLREALRQAEDNLAGGRSIVWPVELRLTPAEGRVLGALVSGALRSVDQLNVAGSVSGVLNELTSNVTSARMCRLRQKIAPYAVTVRNIWGQGYILQGLSLAQVCVWAATGRIDAVPEGDAPDAPVQRVAGVR